MDEEVSALVIAKVNPVTGELHLDAVQTKILIRWLVSIEKTLRQQDVLVKNLKGIVEVAK